MVFGKNLLGHTMKIGIPIQEVRIGLELSKRHLAGIINRPVDGIRHLEKSQGQKPSLEILSNVGDEIS